MNNKYIIPGLLVIGAIGFYLWNQRRVDQLRYELAIIQQNPLPDRTDIPGWTKIVNVLLGLGKDVYGAFRPGGDLYEQGKGTKLDDTLIGDILDSVLLGRKP